MCVLQWDAREVTTVLCLQIWLGKERTEQSRYTKKNEDDNIHKSEALIQTNINTCRVLELNNQNIDV